jgi:hypothetical protein
MSKAKSDIKTVYISDEYRRRHGGAHADQQDDEEGDDQFIMDRQTYAENNGSDSDSDSDSDLSSGSYTSSDASVEEAIEVIERMRNEYARNMPNRAQRGGEYVEQNVDSSHQDNDPRKQEREEGADEQPLDIDGYGAPADKPVQYDLDTDPHKQEPAEEEDFTVIDDGASAEKEEGQDAEYEAQYEAPFEEEPEPDPLNFDMAAPDRESVSQQYEPEPDEPLDFAYGVNEDVEEPVKEHVKIEGENDGADTYPRGGAKSKMSSTGNDSDSDDESISSTIVLSKTSLYYVLSKVFMTEQGLNMADLLADVTSELKHMNTRLASIERKLSAPTRGAR